MSALSLPKRGPGRQSAAAESDYQSKLKAFCRAIVQIRSRLDFDMSARGWCYILEDHGLAKGDFDAAESLIAECRKSGLLPLDIVAEDGSRQFENLESIDNHDPEQEARDILERLGWSHEQYFPVSFWDFQPVYIEMLVEKVDLKSLFNPVCGEFHVPIANARGWSDLNTRAAMMRRFMEHEERGRRCVLLYCGDHDPAGLSISKSLHSNLSDLANAVGWNPCNLTINRFGLNADFIKRHRLTWIDNLETGSGRDLNDPRHPDHQRDYVQDYLAEHGARKVEANALVKRPEAGRNLCRAALEKYVDTNQIPVYRAELETKQATVYAEVKRLLAVTP